MKNYNKYCVIQNENKSTYLLGDFNISLKYQFQILSCKTKLLSISFIILLPLNNTITVLTKVDERKHTFSLKDHIYTNIRESDGDMSGVFKTHISNYNSFFSIHIYDN